MARKNEPEATISPRLLELLRAEQAEEAELLNKIKQLNAERRAADKAIEQAQEHREDVATRYRLGGDGAPSADDLEAARQGVHRAREEADGFVRAIEQLRTRLHKRSQRRAEIETLCVIELEQLTRRIAQKHAAAMNTELNSVLEPLRGDGSGSYMGDRILSGAGGVLGHARSSVAAASRGPAAEPKLPLPDGSRAPLDTPAGRQRLTELKRELGLS